MTEDVLENIDISTKTVALRLAGGQLVKELGITRSDLAVFEMLYYVVDTTNQLAIPKQLFPYRGKLSKHAVYMGLYRLSRIGLVDYTIKDTWNAYGAYNVYGPTQTGRMFLTRYHMLCLHTILELYKYKPMDKEIRSVDYSGV